jgi:hypothetical protein
MNVRRTLTALLLLVSGCLGIGCNNIGPFGRPVVRFASEDGTRRLMQRFAEGYGTQSADGVYDIVLVSEGTRSTGVSSRPGAVLVPGHGSPVRQVVHLRVFWRPVRGARANSPAATNTVIHWYLTGEGADGKADFLQYDGHGFLRVWPADKGRVFKVKIINADLAAVERTGEMQDVLGPATAGGFFKVTVDPGRVTTLLAGIEERGAVAEGR